MASGKQFLMLYGAPILPGAMTLLARIGPAQVMGVPACSLYFQTTSFDLALPRLLAGLTFPRRDLASLATGAFSLEGTFPRKVLSANSRVVAGRVIHDQTD